MPINYDPIFTNIGLNKIANAILTESSIELTTIKVGDSLPDLDYQFLPNDLDIKNFVANTNVSYIHYLDLKESNNTILRVKGTISYQESEDYTLREYGVYDSVGDLIIVGRMRDTEMKAPADIRTELEIVINIAIHDSQKAFITNNVPDSDYVSDIDLTAHIEAKNPHGLTKEDFELDRVDNTSDLDKPTNPYIAQLFYDTKLGVGVGDRSKTTITKNGNIITLTPLQPTNVYKRGVRYILDTPVSINVSIRQSEGANTYPKGYIGGYYVAYNPESDSLYIIIGNPDFDNDILITWFYRNSTNGIIWLAEERHAASKNSDMHRLHHLEIGATWIAGGLLLATLDDANNNKITVTTPIQIADEDINVRIMHNDTPTDIFEQKLIDAKLPVLYLDSNEEYRIRNNNNENLNWLYNGNGAVYNNVVTGTLVSVPSGKYICYWVLFTTDMTEPVKLLIGRAVHDTVELAGAEVLESSGLPMPELVGAYKIVLNVDNANSNLAKTKVHSVFEISNSTRKSSVKANSHTLLLGRNTEGQHSVNAIKGLNEALAGAGRIRKVEMTGTIKADITEVDNSGKITLDTYMSDGRNMVNIDNPVFTDLVGNAYDNISAYAGAVLAPNGKIYCVPHTATQVLEIDPDTKTTTLIGSVYSGSGKWFGGALALDGKIYCAPHSGAQVLEIDPVAKTTTLIGSVYSGGAKWIDIALAPNGNLYCAPSDATNVLEINPYTKITNYIGIDYGANRAKWAGIGLAPNGKLYCAPRLASRVLEIDPIAKTTTLIGSVYSGGGSKWAGISLGADGNLYSAPFGNRDVLKIDPITGETSLIAHSSEHIGGAYHSLVLGLDGNIYCIPFASNYILKIDIPNQTAYFVGGLLVGENRWIGTALSSNGKIYCAPYKSPKVLEIDTFPKSTDFQSYLKLPS